MEHFLNTLNKVQREAVSSLSGSLLVLAGAGSGKTRVLTHRIAWLIQTRQVSPLSILAMTFTNKAAKEMQERVEKLLHIPFGGTWIGTFHGLCYRLLRMHYKAACLPTNKIEILDSDDQHRIIRRVLRELNLDEANWSPRQLQWMINNYKEEGRRSCHLSTGKNIKQRTQYEIYSLYENICQRSGLVDFSEILLRTFELFRNNQSILETYQKRFQHILIDEFQDTNSIQYQWLRLLVNHHHHFFVVGDDDQSIYGWRGARIDNILSFEKDFSNSKVLRLEQNYRSTGNILHAANAVISNNADRMGKNLWTDSSDGERIKVYTAIDDIDEAHFVVDQIFHWVEQGNRRDTTAILYRSNAQSRVFEEQLLARRIPYRVYGGLRFFQRAEIKDALAYLKLILNRNSDPAFERIVNLPVRGIGDKTLSVIQQRSKQKQISMWQSSYEVVHDHLLSKRESSSITRFQALIDTLTYETEKLALEEMTEYVIKRSGLLDYHKKEKGERGQGKIDNLEELVNAARNFVINEKNQKDSLSLFLSNITLEERKDNVKLDDCVHLMSLHSAKGLEFPVVFLCGMEEKIFPHQRSMNDQNQIEEERRLCYVGMTRAMKHLYICYAQCRRLHGRYCIMKASRFLTEIPTKFIENEFTH